MPIVRLSGTSMVDGQAFRQFNAIAGKWRDLAERRRLSFVELQRSGRWKLYYTEAQFVLRMRQVSELAESWAKLAASTPVSMAATAGPPASVLDALVVDYPLRQSAA